MRIEPRFILSILFSLLLLVGNVNSSFGQRKLVHQICPDLSLSATADSLRQLITEFKPQEVIRQADSLLEIYPTLICPALVRIETWKGYAYEHLFKFENCIEIYNELLALAKKHEFIDEEIIIRIALARVYETIGRPELCEQYLNDLEQIFENYNNKALQSHYFVRAASYQRIYKDKDIARTYALKAIKTGEESGRIGSIAGGYLILGIITKDVDESIEYARKASYYCYEEGDFTGHLFQEVNVASGYLYKKDHKAALDVIRDINRKTERLIDNEKMYYEIKAYISSLKAQAFEMAGKKDSLIVALKQNIEYKSLFGDFANQEKINQILLDNSVKIEQEKVREATKRNTYLSIGLALLLGFTLLVLRYYFSNLKKSRQIEEQKATISSQYNELEGLYNYQSTLLHEVHHRIKNNLQVIISLIALQKAKLGDKYDDGIFDMLGYRINSISLIHEQLYSQKEFEKVDVALYAENLIKNFKSLTLGRNVVVDVEIDDIFFNLETMIPLGLIWSELISNSFKYNPDAKDLNIHFEIQKNGDDYTMHYRDNGVGYPDGQLSNNATGMGYTIINSLTRQLSADAKTYNSDGAHFVMSFKQKIISPL